MDTLVLKTNFHKLIDEFENSSILEDFYKAINNYKNKSNDIDIIDELTSKQKLRLNESISQRKNGQIIKNDIIKNEIMQWLMK